MKSMRRNLVVHLGVAHQDVEGRGALHPALSSWSPTNMPLANLSVALQTRPARLLHCQEKDPAAHSSR